MHTDAIVISGMQIRYLVDGSAERRQGMFELRVAPGSTVPPPHHHADNDEIVYVLDGTLRYSVDGVVRDLRPGEFTVSPRGSVHAFSNPFDEPARALVTLSPDIGRGYFAEVAAAMPKSGPPDREKLVAIMARYGLTPAAPTA